jgi:hypothetical protein
MPNNPEDAGTGSNCCFRAGSAGWGPQALRTGLSPEPTPSTAPGQEAPPPPLPRTPAAPPTAPPEHDG